MNYNRQELNVINEATAKASEAINIAHALFIAFFEKYLDGKAQAQSLAFDAENRFYLLDGQVRGIFNMICEAKRKLDVYSCPESGLLNASIRETLEAQEIITYMNTVE